MVNEQNYKIEVIPSGTIARLYAAISYYIKFASDNM